MLANVGDASKLEGFDQLEEEDQARGWGGCGLWGTHVYACLRVLSNWRVNA